MLQRFWIEFADLSDNEPMKFLIAKGCGITAYDVDDAFSILAEVVFKGREFPKPQKIIENVDVSQLDPNHVIPNMGSIFIRGVWWPNCFDKPM